MYIFRSGSCCLRIEYCDAFIAYIRDEDWPLAQNAEVVEGCLAHCLHMTNTGAVVCYAEWRVVHCGMRTDSMLRLLSVRTCPSQHWSADRPSAREVEDSKSIFCIFCRSCILCNLKPGLPPGGRPGVGPFRDAYFILF